MGGGQQGATPLSLSSGSPPSPSSPAWGTCHRQPLALPSRASVGLGSTPSTHHDPPRDGTSCRGLLPPWTGRRELWVLGRALGTLGGRRVQEAGEAEPGSRSGVTVGGTGEDIPLCHRDMGTRSIPAPCFAPPKSPTGVGLRTPMATLVPRTAPKGLWGLWGGVGRGPSPSPPPRDAQGPADSTASESIPTLGSPAHARNCPQTRWV